MTLDAVPCSDSGRKKTMQVLCVDDDPSMTRSVEIMLPDIDGYEVIERLRQAQVSTPIPIQTGLVDRANPRAMTD